MTSSRGGSRADGSRAWASPTRPGPRRCWRAARSAPLLDDEDVLLDLAGHRRPGRGAARPGPAARRDAGNADRLVTALGTDEVLRHRLFAVLGASRELSDFLARHPEQWSAAAVVGRRPADRGRAAAVDAAECRADPDRRADGRGAVATRRPLRVAYRSELLRLAARDVADGAEVADVAAELADLAGGDPRGGAGDRPRRRSGTSAARCRLAVIAMGKCGGRELNYVSDVDVVFVAEAVGRCGRGRRAQGRQRAGLDHDAGLLGDHRRGHDLAGRRGAAAGGQGRAAGAHAGQPRRLLPAVGQDLGVPGAAQGPAGGGRPGARAGVRRGRRRRWSGRPPTGPTSSPTCSRCAAGSRRRCPPRRATAS